MRKIIFIFLILFFVIFLRGNQLSFAQATTPTPIPIQITSIPGIGASSQLLKCGQPDTSDNQCCNIPIQNNADLIQTNIGVAQLLVDAVNAIYKQAIKPILDPLNNAAQQIVQPCVSGEPSTPGNPGDPSCVCIIPTVAPLEAISKLCNNLSAYDQGRCNDCVARGEIYTALDCVSPKIGDFIGKTLLGLGIGLAGVVALLCIIYSAFTMQTSQGNPEKIKKAQELLTSCIMGLMLIIFSVFILRLIGVNILKIPGFE